MPFEKYIPETEAIKKPTARIRPSGLISFNADSVEVFDIGDAAFAILFFDKQKKALGVQITNDDDDSGALKLSKRRNSMSVKAPDFFRRYNFRIDSPQVVPVGRNRDGMLVLDLSSLKRVRGRRPKRS